MTNIPVEYPAPVEIPEEQPDTPVFPPPDDADHIMPPLIESDWQEELRAYHSHLCPCPACADAEYRRKSFVPAYLRKMSQW